MYSNYDNERRRKPSIIFRTDSYKWGHWMQYLPNTQNVYSYLESRNGAKFNNTVFFGLQYYLKEYLAGRVLNQLDIQRASKLAEKHLGPGRFNVDGWQYILDKHYGKLPLLIRSVPEGLPIPVSNCQLTVEVTDQKVPWLTNFVESLLMKIWSPSAVATLSREIKILIKHYLEVTSDSVDGLPYMLHDFGYRGDSSEESAEINGAAHLINFRGTDTILSLLFPEDFYNAPKDYCPGESVLATEHSIMTSRLEKGEFDVVRHILNTTPDGILSVVIDSYDYRRFIKETAKLPELATWLNRTPTNKIVFRPDSGDPVSTSLDVAGLIAELFGVTLNTKGYRIFNQQTGMLWGDGIQYDGIRNILHALKNNGYAASNIVFGMGGGLHTSCTRDTQRNAFKCSAQCYDNQWHDVYKKPLDPTKASKSGRLSLIQDANGRFMTVPEIIKDKNQDLLTPVFKNGEILKEYSWDEICSNAKL